MRIGHHVLLLAGSRDDLQIRQRVSDGLAAIVQCRDAPVELVALDPLHRPHDEPGKADPVAGPSGHAPLASSNAFSAARSRWYRRRDRLAHHVRSEVQLDHDPVGGLPHFDARAGCLPVADALTCHEEGTRLTADDLARHLPRRWQTTT